MKKFKNVRPLLSIVNDINDLIDELQATHNIDVVDYDDMDRILYRVKIFKGRVVFLAMRPQPRHDND